MDGEDRRRPATEADTPCPWWERTSAAVDGELGDDEAELVMAHAGRCERCGVLAGLDGAVPVTIGLDGPPLATEMLTSRERRWLDGGWTRRLLLVAALVILVEAVPSYLSGHGNGAEAHAARHLASWQIGFGVGLFVAAWVSRLSSAILALAVTFATLIVGATVIEAATAHRGPWADWVHVVELVAVFLLWRLAPAHVLQWRRHDATDDAPGRPERADRFRSVDDGPRQER